MARIEGVDDSAAVVLAQRWAAAGGHISLLIECDALTRDGWYRVAEIVRTIEHLRDSLQPGAGEPE